MVACSKLLSSRIIWKKYLFHWAENKISQFKERMKGQGGNMIYLFYWAEIIRVQRENERIGWQHDLPVPLSRNDLSSKRECRDRVATWGLLHLFPPSSTSSSNFTHLKMKIDKKKLGGRSSRSTSSVSYIKITYYYIGCEWIFLV